MVYLVACPSSWKSPWFFVDFLLANKCSSYCEAISYVIVTGEVKMFSMLFFLALLCHHFIMEIRHFFHFAIISIFVGSNHSNMLDALNELHVLDLSDTNYI